MAWISLQDSGGKIKEVFRVGMGGGTGEINVRGSHYTNTCDGSTHNQEKGI